MSGKIYQGSRLVAQTNDAPLGFEDKGIELESLAQYEQLKKDGNLQEDVNYYIKDDGSDLQVSLNNRLTKQYYFNGKTIQFFGDSIAAGVGVDDDSSDLALYKRWPTVFCEITDSTESNSAVSGSLYTRGKNEVISITDKVKATTLNGDYLFLCGGINDWQLGVSLEEFSEAVEECFSYVSENYSGDVVVVAPFNVIKNLVGTPTNSVYAYRQILANKAYKYGFDFINGEKISLPTTRTAGACIQSLFADGLHPSGFGHYVIGYEMMFQFTSQTWDTCNAVADTIIWSGKFLDSLQIPMWRVTKTSFTLSPSETLMNNVLDDRLTNARVILQGYTGAIMYNGNFSAVLPYYNPSAAYISDLVFFCDANGLSCQHKNTLEVSNGNLFFTFIRNFDINNRHSF